MITRHLSDTDSAPAGASTAPDRGAPVVPWANTLAAISLLWLLAVLSSVRHTVGAAATVDPLVVARAAVALPPVISASLIAGVAVSLAAVILLSRRWPAVASRAPLRYAASTTVGLTVGLAVAAPIALGYGELPSILVLSGAVATAAGLGGLLAGVPHRTVVAAGVLGSLGVFVVGFAVGIFDGDLRHLFGAGDTGASVLAANAWVALTTSLAAGLAAGVLGYAYLRRHGPGQRWPAFLAAGAAPGLLVLLAEAVTRLGGAQLVRLVSAVSADDTYLRYLSAARFNRALIVLFVGALVAIFLLGRSLTPEPDEDADEADDDGSDDQPTPAESDQSRLSGTN